MTSRQASPRPGVHPVRDKVAASIRARIADNSYAPGSRLPAMKVLAAEHACSITPVASAIKLLAGEGLIRLVRFEMSFVRDEAQEEARLLAALRLVWAGAYQITPTATGFEAWRMDGTGTLEAVTAAELAGLIREDYPKYAAGVPL